MRESVELITLVLWNRSDSIHAHDHVDSFVKLAISADSRVEDVLSLVILLIRLRAH